MTRLHTCLLLILAAGLFGTIGVAQDQPPTDSQAVDTGALDGRWLGTLVDEEDASEPLEIRLSAPVADDGEWSGALWVVQSGVVDAAFDAIAVGDGDTLTATVTSPRGSVVELSGALSNDGQSLIGTVLKRDAEDNAERFSFTLRRLPLPTDLPTVQHWAGSVETPAMALDIAVAVAVTPAGEAVATIDIPMQGARVFTVFDVGFDESGLRFTIRGPAGEAVTVCTFSEDGLELAGTMTQQGMAMPVTLRRVLTAPEASQPRRPQEPVPPFPYTVDDEIRIPNPAADGVVLAGTLLVPDGEGPFPAAVLVSGSGAQDRDEALAGHRPFWVIADYLARRGIAVLRFDDRGVADSTGDFSAAVTDDFASDALAAVRFLAARDDIIASSIGIIGHSEGGIVAPMAAVQAPDVIAFVVLLAGPAVTGEEFLYAQGELIMRANGTDEETIARQSELRRQIFTLVRQGYSESVIRALLLDLAEEEMADMAEEDRPSEEVIEQQLDAQLERICSPWFRRFVQYDPRPALRQIACPVLALFGGKDLQVPWSQNAPQMLRALSEGHCLDATVRTLPGLNHLFQHSDTGAIGEYSTIEETFAPIALRAIGDWIVSRFLPEE